MGPSADKHRCGGTKTIPRGQEKLNLMRIPYNINYEYSNISQSKVEGVRKFTERQAVPVFDERCSLACLGLSNSSSNSLSLLEKRVWHGEQRVSVSGYTPGRGKNFNI